MFTPKLQIKFDFNCESKVSDFPSSFEDLCKIAKNLFDLTEEEMKNPQFSYIDEDGDKVNISNSYDFEQAQNFAEKENLKIINLEVENLCKVNDFINETTESIKCSDEKDLLFKDNDLKLNNLHLKEEIIKNVKSELKDLFGRKMKRTNSDNIRNILSLAENLKKESERLKTQFNRIKTNTHNKTIYNKKICERNNAHDNINKNIKLDKILFEENELKEIVKKVIEEELESIKSQIIEKSIKKSIYLLFEKKRAIDIKKVNEEMHYNIQCKGCSDIPIKGLRFKCKICKDFDLCQNCEYTLGQEHKHPLMKLRRSESHSNNFEIYSRASDKKGPLKLVIENKFLNKPSSNNFFDKNDYKLLTNNIINNYEVAKTVQENFDPCNFNPKLIKEIIKKTKGNLDDAISYLIK